MLALLLLGATGGCREATESITPVPPREPGPDLLALGDSYTVGHGLPEAWSWPAQLADTLAAQGEPLRRRDVVAGTGWTARDLLDALRDSLNSGRLGDSSYEVVTVMIGVNNQFQGLPTAAFAAELDTLLAVATWLAGGDGGRVVGFTIPNYGLTPVGALYGTARVTAEIAEFNRILGGVMASRGIPVIDITTSCDAVMDEGGLVARDGLHYSREMYRRWVVLMGPEIERCLQSTAGRQ